MSYTSTTDIHLGPSRTGLTLTAQFRNADGTLNGSGSATLAEIGQGDYTAVATVPDGFQGWLRVYNGASYVGMVALNPQESENPDVKTSTRSSHTAADVWAVGTRTLTSFGTLVADVAAAVWAAAARTLTAFGFTPTVGGYAAGTAPPLATDYTAARAGKLDNLDTNVGSRGTGDATVANQTTINTNVLSRLAGVSYTAPPSVGAIDTQLTGTHGAGLWQQGNTVAPDNAGIAAIKAKTDNLPADPASNTEVDTRLATTGYMAPPSPASVTAAIWGDSANYADGSKGAELATSSTAHDPWATDLPGGYTNPQAGYIIGTRLDVAVGSRAIAGSVTQTAPYSASGLIRLHVGADYGPSPGHLPRVLWTVGPGVAPDATDGTFVVSIPGLVGSPFVGHIVIASPSDVQLFEGLFTHTQTAGWITGTHHFRALLTTAGGAQIIIAEGLIEVGPGA